MMTWTGGGDGSMEQKFPNHISLCSLIPPGQRSTKLEAKNKISLVGENNGEEITRKLRQKCGYFTSDKRYSNHVIARAFTWT